MSETIGEFFDDKQGHPEAELGIPEATSVKPVGEEGEEYLEFLKDVAKIDEYVHVVPALPPASNSMSLADLSRHLSWPR